MKFRRRSSTSAAQELAEKQKRPQQARRKKRKEDISLPMPIVLDSEKLYEFQVNNNMFLLEGCGSSIACSTSTESKSRQLETPSTGRCTNFTDESSTGESSKFNFSPSIVASYAGTSCQSPLRTSLDIRYSNKRDFFRYQPRTRRTTTGDCSERDGIVSDSDQTGHSEFDSCTENSPLHTFTPFPPKPPRMKQYRTFVCQNLFCGKQEHLLGHTEVLFRSCKFCFTHYCSPLCQQFAWKEHIRVCFYGQIHSNLELLVDQLQNNDINIFISDIAYNSYKNRGRGCVFLVFSSAKRLEQFVNMELQNFRAKPTYSTVADISRHGVKNKYQTQLLDFISNYDPATQIVVSIAVVVGKKIPSNPVPRKKEVTVRKIVHLYLNKQYANTSILLRESSLRKPSTRNCLERKSRRKTL